MPWIEARDEFDCGRHRAARPYGSLPCSGRHPGTLRNHVRRSPRVGHPGLRVLIRSIRPAVHNRCWRGNRDATRNDRAESRRVSRGRPFVAAAKRRVRRTDRTCRPRRHGTAAAGQDDLEHRAHLATLPPVCSAGARGFSSDSVNRSGSISPGGELQGRQMLGIEFRLPGCCLKVRPEAAQGGYFGVDVSGPRFVFSMPSCCLRNKAGAVS